jgi:N5-(cytidine 5'-diphosphoramidyl)-L-glutamine hydrolase
MKLVGLTQRVELVPTHRERRDSLDQAWTCLLQTLGFLPVPLPNGPADKVEAYLDNLAFGGIILTGGNDLCVSSGSDQAPERDRFERSLLDACIKRRLPVLGVCRGMQMMIVYHGGTISEIDGHAASRHEINLEAEAFKSECRSRTIASYHNFGILPAGLPPNVRPIAWAPDGSIEAICHVHLPHYGIMWHPEREDPCHEMDLLMIQRIFEGING